MNRNGLSIDFLIAGDGDLGSYVKIGALTHQSIHLLSWTPAEEADRLIKGQTRVYLIFPESPLGFFLFPCADRLRKMQSGFFAGGGMKREQARANRLTNRLGVVLVGALFLAAGCGTTPTYYSSVERTGTLGCFKSVPSYYEKHADIPRMGGTNATQYLLSNAISRLNGIFTGDQGIYHHLFYQHWSSRKGPPYISDNKDCAEDRVVAGEHHVAISPFSIPPAPKAAAAAEADKKKPDHAENKAGNTLTIQLQNTPKPAPKPQPKPAAKKTAAKEPAGKTPPKASPSSSQEQNADPAPKPSAPAKSEPAEIDLASETVQKTQIVISSYLYTNHPADRLDKVYAVITPLDPGVEFVSVDEVAVSSKIIDFGDVTRNSSVDFSAFPLGTLLGQAVTATPKMSSSLQRKVQRQYATQNVEIFPLRNSLLVSEDGGPVQADISGNKSVTVTLRIPAGSTLCRYHTVYDLNPNGKPEGEATAAFSRADTCYIERIPAVMGAVAVVREVSSWGRRTVEEDDDAVTLLPFKTLTVFDLWINPFTLYGVDLGDSAVVVYANDVKLERILFASFRAALSFRGWLAEQVTDTTQLTGLKGRSLEWPYREGAKVRLGLEADRGKGKGSRITTCVYRKPDPDMAPYHFPRRPDSEFCSLDN